METKCRHWFDRGGGGRGGSYCRFDLVAMDDGIIGAILGALYGSGDEMMKKEMRRI